MRNVSRVGAYILAGLIVAGVVLASSQSLGGRGSAVLGVYSGPDNVQGVREFAQVTGSDVAIGSDYLPASSGWVNEVSGLEWLLRPWQVSGYRLALGVPMIPTNSAGRWLTTLAQGAKGVDNAYFARLAKSLVEGGEGRAFLRLGWEFDGNGYPWMVTTSKEAANFAEYWRQIVTTMRGVAGADFTFVWNPDVTSFSSSNVKLTEQSYPGSAYVGEMGGDIYDQSWYSGCGLAFNNRTTTAEERCDWGRVLLPALNRMAAYAVVQGVPLAFPEFGVAMLPRGHGLGDDPYFIEQFSTWVRSHNVVWLSYFNFDSGRNYFALNDGHFPKALAMFKEVFGG